MKFADIKPVPGYEDLERVLCAAYMQAAVGKGAERHADAKPFGEQPMQTIAQSYGTVDGMLFQVSKKLGESRGLPDGRAQAEVLGAIVYSAGVHIAYDTWAPRRALNNKPEAFKPEAFKPEAFKPEAFKPEAFKSGPWYPEKPEGYGPWIERKNGDKNIPGPYAEVFALSDYCREFKMCGAKGKSRIFTWNCSLEDPNSNYICAYCVKVEQ